MRGMLRFRQIEKEDPEYHVDREKLNAFNPIRLTISADLEQDIN
jgi:hypothetical protein